MSTLPPRITSEYDQTKAFVDDRIDNLLSIFPLFKTFSDETEMMLGLVLFLNDMPRPQVEDIAAFALLRIYRNQKEQSERTVSDH